MRTRTAAAKLITKQLNNGTKANGLKGRAWHYGKVELRELLDFIYKREPRNKLEKVTD